jgi:hypothetical protein
MLSVITLKKVSIMKKLLLPAALLCSFAALAQTSAASVKQLDAYAAVRPKQEAKTKGNPKVEELSRLSAQRKPEARTEDLDSDDHEGGNESADTKANHGQTVAAFAHSTTLTGANKGAAVSALARNGRSTPRGEHKHEARGERGARGNQCRDQKTHRKQQNGGRRRR